VRKTASLTVAVSAAAALSLSIAMITAGSAVAAGSGAAAGSSAPAGVHLTGDLHYAPNIHIPSTHLPHPTAVGYGPFNTTLYQSENWSGYAALAGKGDKLTSVSAEFTVPSVNCADSSPGADGAYTGEWIGLDGFSSATVEQEGVDAYCASTTSAPEYEAWYEMYPSAPVAFTGTINAGDAIRLSTGRYKSGNSYLLTLLDFTTGAGFSTTQACPSGSSCLASSAEAIMEAPSESTGILPLADYGEMTFASAKVEANFTTKEAGTLAASKYWSTAEIQMVSSSDALESDPGPLEGGSDFCLTWLSS
jgi:Peptidase A4 family